jgi:hypothetical protein
VVAMAILAGFFVPLAHAAQEDRVVIGDLRTVGISAPYGGVGCGGALIAPRIVYTAAHCVSRTPRSNLNTKTWGVPIVSGVIPENLLDIYVTHPGIDIALNREKKVKVIAQFASPLYKDSCQVRNCHPSTYDFAVLILEEEIATPGFKVATREEVTEWVDSEVSAFGIGYGQRSYQGDQDKPGMYFVSLRSIPNKVQDFADLNDPNNPYMHIQGKCTSTIMPCAGVISGSPLWIEKNGESIYIGAASAVSGPFARIAPTDPLWSDAFWSVNAQVEYYTAQAFPDVIKVANEFLAEQIIRERKTAAAANPVPLKKITITCIKGKVTKKVTGIKPNCPKGYKKK